MTTFSGWQVLGLMMSAVRAVVLPQGRLPGASSSVLQPRAGGSDSDALLATDGESPLLAFDDAVPQTDETSDFVTSQGTPACDGASIIWHPPVNDSDFEYYPSLKTPGWPLVADKRKLTYLTLVNGTPQNFTVVTKQQQQMSSFDLDNVETGVARQFAQQYRLPTLLTPWKKNHGNASYALQPVEGQQARRFQVEATTDGNDMAELYHLQGLPASRNISAPVPPSTKLPQRGGSRAYNLVISGSEKTKTYYTPVSAPVAWMQEIIDVIGGRKLKHVCMPGSHDAGMSTINGSTAFVDRRNVLTQTFNIHGQLLAGSRYFDIRPVIGNVGQYLTGHYNLPSDVPLGANGQTLTEIVDEINRFTDEYPELVVIRLSHAYNTDDGYRPFTDDEWAGAFRIFRGLNHRLVNAPGDITEIRINELIGDGRPCVIVTATGGNAQPSNGVYAASSFPISDHWSNTDDVKTMAQDQIDHLSSDRHLARKSTKDTFLIMQWLLTLEDLENVPITDWISIESLAIRLAYDALFWKAWNAFTPEMYPSVILMDYIGTLQPGTGVAADDGQAARDGGGELRAFVMAVNLAVASRNCFVGGGSIY